MSLSSISSLQRRLRLNGDHGKANQQNQTSIPKMRQGRLRLMHNNYDQDKIHSALIVLILTVILTLMTVTATQ